LSQAIASASPDSPRHAHHPFLQLRVGEVGVERSQPGNLVLVFAQLADGALAQLERLAAVSRQPLDPIVGSRLGRSPSARMTRSLR